MTASSQGVRLGLRENLGQFGLLVGVNALVGGMLGQERTLLPLLAREIFHLEAFTSALTFIVAFGSVKAITNYFAGILSDRYGRKPVLVAGWLVGLPVPLLIIWSPTWGWIIFANVLLGVNQGLTWSTTVIMKIDLVGPARRGTAMGFNEAAGYIAVAATALATGYIAANIGLRPEPFYLGLAYAALGLMLSAVVVRETRGHMHHESLHDTTDANASIGSVFRHTSFHERALSAACQAGLVNNLNDGLTWGLLPLFLTARGLTVGSIGVIAAVYPAVWGLGQLATGAMSDCFGRKRLIVAGMWLQGAALAGFVIADTFSGWVYASVALGVGTAMVYPALLAVIGDVAHPAWRASSVGAYRFWRDAGFPIGALAAGATADVYGLSAAFLTVAVVTAVSGVVVAVRMYETHPPVRTGEKL